MKTYVMLLWKWSGQNSNFYSPSAEVGNDNMKGGKFWIMFWQQFGVVLKGCDFRACKIFILIEFEYKWGTRGIIKINQTSVMAMERKREHNTSKSNGLHKVRGDVEETKKIWHKVKWVKVMTMIKNRNK